jgi:hypothetical protein
MTTHPKLAEARQHCSAASICRSLGERRKISSLESGTNPFHMHIHYQLRPLVSNLRVMRYGRQGPIHYLNFCP